MTEVKGFAANTSACSSKNSLMLTYHSHSGNKITNHKYTNDVNSLNIHSFECPHCHHQSLIKYGHYKRKVYCFGGYEAICTLVIQRLYCKHCHTTHALLPDCLITYSHFFLEDALMILESNDDDKHFLDICYELTIAVIQKLKSKFNHWIKLHQLSNPFDLPISLFQSLNLHLSLYQHHNQASFSPSSVP